MGAFISQMVGKLLGDSKPPIEGPIEGEIDHNICVCCGTVNVAEQSDHEKDSQHERDGD